MSDQTSSSAGAPLNVLRIDASMRIDGSATRALADRLIARLNAKGPVQLETLDLATDAPALVDAAWIGANFTDADERSSEQVAKLEVSERLIRQLENADMVVIATPIYNFSVPAALKAWIDTVARARRTFRYTPEGPVGLLEGKRAIVVTASGGTPIDSPIDFSTPYLRHVLGFIGVKDVQVAAAERQMADDGARTKGEAAVDAVQL